MVCSPPLTRGGEQTYEIDTSLAGRISRLQSGDSSNFHERKPRHRSCSNCRTMNIQTHPFPFDELFRGNPSNNSWKWSDPPEILHTQGTPKAFELFRRLPEDGLAIVGTRQPQHRSLQLLRKSLKMLEGTNLIIVSGLAIGIDTVAHTSALEAKLPTIAVLGAGLDIPYPWSNQDLRKRILNSDGLIVSEFPTASPPRKHHFLQRNRLIAGLTRATCIIEAAQRSGALNTAKWAREQDRTCFAVPCFPEDPALAGNQILLDRDHALPFWNASSLGVCWLELATLKMPQSETLSPHCSKDALKLFQKAKKLSSVQGATDVQQLLDWAFSEHWDPARFYGALGEAIRCHLILERGNSIITH